MDINNVLDLLNINNKNNTISLNGLEFVSESINKSATIQIYGDENTSKTLFAKTLIKNNPQKLFLYMDTYYKTVLEDETTNTILLRSNDLEDLFNALESEDAKNLDCVIIDTFANLKLSEEQEQSRYFVLYELINKLISMTTKNKIVLILLNTTNGAGNAYCSNYQIKSLLNTIIKFEHFDSRDKLEIINAIVEKNKMGERKEELIYLNRDF